jgi:hypothetical protein
MSKADLKLFCWNCGDPEPRMPGCENYAVSGRTGGIVRIFGDAVNSEERGRRKEERGSTLFSLSSFLFSLAFSLASALAAR